MRSGLVRSDGLLVCLLAALTLVSAAAPSPAARSAAAPIWPSTFTGSFTDEQSTPGYTVTGRGLQFGSFTATVTFTDLVLREVPGGGLWKAAPPVQVAFSGFTETTSYSGCLAEWTFPGAGFVLTDPPELHLGLPTDGKAKGVLAFSGTASGTISVVSGCEGGPPSQWYNGGDLPFSGYAPVTYDERTGVISVDATYPPPPFYAGSGLSATDKGLLNGGPLIWLHDKQNVTGQTTKVVVGDRIDFDTHYANGDVPKSPDWTGVPAAPAAFADYTYSLRLGNAKPVSRVELQDTSRIAFYFARSGTYTVKVTGKNPTSGLPDTAEATFDVETPEVDAFAARQCSVHVNNNSGRNLDVEIRMGLSSERGCAGYGIVWRAHVTAPREAGGTVAMTQLLIPARSRNGAPCTWPTGPGAGRPGTDNTLVYQAGVRGPALRFDVAAGASGGRDDVTDAPGFSFKRPPPPVGTVWRNDLEFADFLMFRPDGPGSAWVALRQLDWHERFTIQRQLFDWQLKSADPGPRAPAAVPSGRVATSSSWTRDGEPRWTGSYQNDNQRCPRPYGA